MIPDRLQASGADKVPSPSGSCNCSRCADGERVCGDPPVRFADDVGAFTAPGEERPSEMRSPGGRNCRRGEGRARNGSAAARATRAEPHWTREHAATRNWSSCVVASSSSGWPRASHELRDGNAEGVRILKPRVARDELPWEQRAKSGQPCRGCISGRGSFDSIPLGLAPFGENPG
jgi:hypothetical protein